jgi:site-specific recombinase XerD
VAQTGGLAMTTRRSFASAAARYDAILRGAHHRRMPKNYPAPQPMSAWLPENVELLERYYQWLVSGGASLEATHHLYLPMAGHVLGLNPKPHSQLDLDVDLNRAIEYVQAKQLSQAWVHNCRNALDKFRRFLRQERGQHFVTFLPPNPQRYCQGLPDWLIEQLERYLHVQERNWRPARVNQQAMRFWGNYTRVWRWLFEHYSIQEIADIKRKYLLDFIDDQLKAKYATTTINNALRCFHECLLFLQEQEYRIPQSLLRLPTLKEPDALPRFLTDEQVRLVRDDLEKRVTEAKFSSHRRDALLDRAAFYLMWHGGLRLGEVEELRLEDLDLGGRKLIVRQGKGRKDRTIYLTDTLVRVLKEYLAVRGMGPSDHVFLYRNLAVHKDLISSHIRYAGQRVGVKVSPHCLRHTCATQLLNAGCRITSIQKLLGHRQIDTTLIYARVHDRTVAEDYYAAMTNIEKCLDPSVLVNTDLQMISVNEHAQLLELVSQLAEPQLELDARLNLVEQMRYVITGKTVERIELASTVQV